MSEVQATGPDAFNPPPDTSAEDPDNPDDNAQPETDVQHAERLVQDQLVARFVTHQRYAQMAEDLQLLFCVGVSFGRFVAIVR